MEPEIARRCPRCGASVRGAAFFCPQCGTPVKTHGVDGGVGSTDAGADTSDRSQSGGDNHNSSHAPATAAPTNETRSAAANAAAAPPVVVPPATAAAPPRVMEAEGGHSRRHRTSSAREAVGEKLAPRMEKLRQASNVMLDEAAYDPSMRFVLVAVAILLLTLLLFLLHGLLG